MAKSKSSKNRHTARAGRDHSQNYRSLTVTLPPPLPSPRLSPKAPLLEVEDRRQFHFDSAQRSAKTVLGTPAAIKVSDAPRPGRNVPSSKKSVRAQSNRYGPNVHSQTKGKLVFAEPDRVVVCVRRQRRKEVLFAKKRAGKSGLRKPRFNWMSKISCRRT